MMPRVDRPRNRTRTCSGAVTTSACSWLCPSTAASTAARRAVSRTCRAAPLAAGPRLRQLRAGQGVPGSADGVDRVGLRAGLARGSGGAVELDDELILLGKVSGQPGAVASRALHRPGPQRPVGLGEPQQCLIASGVGRHGRLGQHRAGGRGDDRGGVGVFVGVDADDDLDLLCEHGQLRSPLTRDGRGPGPVRELGRTVMGHASGYWRSGS
jgi:hypothetical protein